MNEDLFLHLAEIAGVFVGFGALIALRTAGTDDPHARGYLRGIVWMGTAAVVFALLPVLLSGYGLGGHTLWLTCAIVAAVVYVLVVVIDNLAPDMSGTYEAEHRAYGIAFMSVGMPLHLTIGAGLLLIMLGVFREVEPALYATVVAAVLAFAAWTLVMLVWVPRPPKKADPERAVTSAETPDSTFPT